MQISASQRVRCVLQAAVLVLASVGLVLIAAEVLLRVLTPAGHFIWPPHLSRTFVPAPGVMPGISGESKFRTNSRGFRADELDASHAYRILTVGGSTTECLYLDQSEAWPQLLQDALNAGTSARRTWVGNAGMSGRNSRHHLTALRHLPLDEMKIDAVVLLAGVNDLSIRLSQGEAYDPTAMTKSDMQDKLAEETFMGTQYRSGNPDDPWLKRTHLWQQMRKLKVLLARRQSNRKDQDHAGAVYTTWRSNRQQAPKVLNSLPDITSSLDEYSSNIKESIKFAKAHSVRVILMTQPAMWKPGLSGELAALLWLGGVGDFQDHAGQPYYSIEVLAEAMRRYNDRILDICQTEQVECIDLSGIPKDASTFYDDVHFNEQGAKAVAHIVSKHFASMPPFSH